MSTKRWIIVRTQFEGFHRYPDAPQAVDFLRSLHRHIFHVTVQIETFHSDRELEFILVKRDLQDFLETFNYPQTSSCEHIAEDILEYLQRRYDSPLEELYRRYSLEVSEDGENGALLQYEPRTGAS